MQVDLRRRGLQSFDPAEFANTDEHLHLLLQVRQLDLSYNALYTIRGLEGLTHLTVLNISHNGLRSLGGGLPLTLRELDASHNNIASLQNAALLPLRSLTSLNVSFNDLEDLRGVPNVTAQLTHLDVRSNRLASLDGIEHCGQLSTLHAEANLLREVADVASLKCLSLLKTVYLSGNPLLLRKRLLSQLHLLLPAGVEQDDLPTTAPPSSVRSSTAAPPSVPDTSSAGSLEHSTVASICEGREEPHYRSARDGGGGSSLLPSAPRGTALSLHSSTTGTHDVSALAERASASALYTSSSIHRSRDVGVARAAEQPRCLPAPSSSSSTAPPPDQSTPALVGGAADSPSCPRRPLPHEHHLGDSPCADSDDSSQGRTHATSTAGRQPASGTRAVRPASDLRLVAALRGSGSRSSDLVLDELEERLMRVTAERDDYRRQVIALRSELRELRKALAPHFEQQQEAADASKHAREEPPLPPSRILAVEMSAHSSVCSQGGESDTPESRGSGHHDARPQVAPHPPILASASRVDRREIAALFMAKLQASNPCLTKEAPAEHY
ncbi:Leucine Rich repeat [Novymonas esmeraldas]|uniref:Leucine Rich repeat n=1 Tax=Novymonas esmeraldas TaxID=1808958 RepID=A0AAW0F2T7_9TRYP